MERVLGQAQAPDSVSLDDCATKLLGLNWSPKSDKFTFQTKLLQTQEIISKRVILSEIAQLFDPLGIVSPVVITAKILLQELWLHKLSWDSPVSSSIAEKWLRIKEELIQLNTVSMPRWLGTHEHLQVELNGFSDAFQLAMAAVI